MQTVRLRFLPVIAAMLVVACNEPSAPEAPVAEVPAFRIFPTYASDGKSADLVVEPSGGVFVLGKHALYFPANTICDPAISTYGPTEWDAPCTTITRPISIHAELVEKDGRSWVDFTPHLRFAPSEDEHRWVYLFMYTKASEGKKLTGNNAPAILWSPAIGVAGIDEALTDETLKTKWDKKLGGVYRRIKHFSGYNVWSGYAGAAQDY
jgi:hypothetical protein